MAKQKFDFFLYPKARQDMESIFDYIKEELKSPQAALNIIDKFYKAIINVCYFPLSCPPSKNEGIKNKNLRKIIVDDYIIFYRADEEAKSIEIIRVIYGMRNMADIL